LLPRLMSIMQHLLLGETVRVDQCSVPCRTRMEKVAAAAAITATHIKHACNVAKATFILRTLHATMLFCHQTPGHHGASCGIITVCTHNVRLLSCCLCWRGSDVPFRHQPLHGCLDGGAALCCLSRMRMFDPKLHELLHQLPYTISRVDNISL